MSVTVEAKQNKREKNEVCEGLSADDILEGRMEM